MKKIILIFLMIAINLNNANALIKVDITRGNLDPLPIAISPLHVDKNSQKSDLFDTNKLGEEISKIIEQNARSTGLFNPLNKDAFVQKPDIAHLKPRFEDWRLIKAQALVTGKLLIKDDLYKLREIFLILKSFKLRLRKNFKYRYKISDIKNLIYKKGVKLEYLELRDKHTLSKNYKKSNFRIFISYYYKKIRFIDNI